MEYSSSEAIYKVTSAAKLITAILFYILAVSCTVTKNQDINILVQYCHKQKYARSKAGHFIQDTEKLVVSKLSKDFARTNNIIIISEFCDPFYLNEYIYSQDDQKGTFFSRISENSSVNFNPSYSIAPILYERIINLLQNDSLSYYQKADAKEFEADDEFCRLSVTHGRKSGNTYSERRYDFYKPLALRGKIINH